MKKKIIYNSLVSFLENSTNKDLKSLADFYNENILKIMVEEIAKGLHAETGRCSRLFKSNGDKKDSFIFIKGLVFLIIGLVMFSLLFFAPILQKENSGLSISVGISGLSVFISMFNGLNYSGVANGIGTISFELPVVPVVLLFIGLLCSLSVVVLGAYDLIRGKANRRNAF